MRTIPLGCSELAVSAICLGTMTFGTAVPEDQSRTILDRFVSRGGTFLDTANNYAFWADGGTGDESETMLGRWLADTGFRDEVVLATKIGARPRPGSSS
ncbi:MAG: aldo/keto reductase, partial [Actinomycetota bacterium]